MTRAISKSEHTDYQYFGGNVQQRTAVIEKSDQSSSTVIAMSVVGIAPREADFVDGFLQTRFFDVASAKLVWVAHTKVVNDGRKADALCHPADQGACQGRNDRNQRQGFS
jgi:hypothetical protein